MTFIITPAYATEISDALANLYNTNVQAGEIAIMWLGSHQKGPLEGYASAGFVIKTANNIIAIDPSNLLSEDIDSLEKLDVIFITHDHGDHFHPDTIVAMQTKTGSFVITDPTSMSMLRGQISEDKLIQIRPNEQMTISEITVNAFRAQHPVVTPLMYVIEVDGFRIFHGSDSAFVENLNEIDSRVHLALVPTGDPSPSASPTDAFEMTRATNPYIVIPMHGSPQQMQEFSDIVKQSELQAQVIIPTPLEVMVPVEIVPEFGEVTTMVLGFAVLSIIALSVRLNAKKTLVHRK